MKVLMTGGWSDIASIMTTGSPSAKLGKKSTRAARISSLTCSLLIQPVPRAHARNSLGTRQSENKGFGRGEGPAYEKGRGRKRPT